VATLEEYSPAQMIACCLCEMTEYGFCASANEALRNEPARRVAEIDAMTSEERAE
jgi:hypothetical protein